MSKVLPDDEVVYKGHLTLVRRAYNGMKYDVVVSKDAAVMLYIDEYDNAYLTKQFRPALGKEVIALPAETLDKNGLSPLEVMVEGLIEECGIKISPKQIIYCGKVDSTDGHDTEYVHLYLAHGKGEKVGQKLTESEEIEVITMPFNELYQRVMNNEIEGSKTRCLVLEEKIRRLDKANGK